MAQPTPAEQKQIRAMKFPESFGTKVDLRKVNLEVMKKWMAQSITEHLGMEDEVAVDFAYEVLTDPTSVFPNPKLLQVKLQGFLGDKQSGDFCKQLWALLLSAQDSNLGVPAQLLEAKKAELKQERAAAEQKAKEDKERREQEAARDREIDSLRRRDRDDRHQRRPGRDWRDSRRSDSRRSRSPPRRYDTGRRYRSRSPPRRRDYSPQPRRRRESPQRSRRQSSPSYRREPHRPKRSSASPSRRASSSPSRRSSQSSYADTKPDQSLARRSSSGGMGE